MVQPHGTPKTWKLPEFPGISWNSMIFKKISVLQKSATLHETFVFPRPNWWSRPMGSPKPGNYLNFIKFSEIPLIPRFWWSHGSGPSIWPRKNKRFVKGHGFVENNDFLIFNGNSLDFMISHENDWNSWIHKNFSDLHGNSTFAPTCENSSNSKLF